MGSICIKCIGGRKRLFKGCGGMIKPTYERRNNQKVPYRKPYKSDYDAFKDQEVIDFLKKHKEATFIMLFNKQTPEKELKSYGIDNDIRFLKIFKNCLMVYDKNFNLAKYCYDKKPCDVMFW